MPLIAEFHEQHAAHLLQLAGDALLVGASFGEATALAGGVVAPGQVVGDQQASSAKETGALLASCLPYGLTIVGVASNAPQSKDVVHIAQKLHDQLLPAWSAPDKVLLLCQRSGEKLQLSAVGGGSVSTTASPSISGEAQAMLPRCQLLRALCKVDVPVIMPATQEGPAAAEKALQEAILRAEEGYFAGASAAQAVLLIKRGQQQQQQLVTSSTDGSVGSLLSGAAGPLEVRVMQRPEAPDSAPPAPALICQPPSSPTTMQLVQVELDVLLYVPEDLPLRQLLPQAVLPALQRQLLAALRHVAALRLQGEVVVRPHHFLPPGYPHHLTLLYAFNTTDEAHAEEQHMPLRRSLHALLGLPMNRPMLRLSNAISLDDSSAGASAEGGRQLRLLNVHEGLQPPLDGAPVSLVQGRYWYHHYMQDRFNDSGWGCAYRSLQTLCSWFHLQRYTTKLPPSHREVQEMLVRMGDKEAAFVGSSSWIGAIELGYVLDAFLGVTCKVLTVQQGADIPSYARQLAQHFATQGTPVMIGGGVLAYTLLGVQFDDSTGECAFLILDPHYTGGEDLKKIHGGTWVGWKKLGDTAAAGGPLFVPTAFYNFLCPQLPNTL